MPKLTREQQELADSMAMLILQVEPGERRQEVIRQIGETYAEELRKLKPDITDDEIRTHLENLIKAAAEREKQIERSGGAGGGTA